MNYETEFTDEELSEAFRDVGTNTVPSEMHFEMLRSSLLAQTQRTSGKATQTTIPDVDANWPAKRKLGLTGKLVLSTAIASLIVLMIQPFSGTAAAGLRSALNATRQQTWIHASTVVDFEGDLTQSESWCSPQDRIAAFRSTHALHFVNYRDGLQSSYSSQNNVIYHWRADTQMEEFGRTFVLALLSNDNLQTLLPMHTISMVQSTSMNFQGRPRVQYFFELKQKNNPSISWQSFVQADRDTGRIVSWEERHSGGMHVSTTFDYPDSGPGDIYKLGASANAKVVDRIASSDVVEIAERFEEQVYNFGDFEAIVIDQIVPAEGGSVLPPLFRRLRRAGEKFQVDLLLSTQQDILIPDDADYSWWQMQQSQFESTPLAVCNDKSCTIYPAEDPRLGIADEMLPLATKETRVPVVTVRNKSGSTTIPLWPSIWPEYACRPLLMTSDPTIRFVVDPAGSDGPANTLRIRLLTPDSPFSKERASYWLSPEHSHCVVKSSVTKTDFAVLAGSPRERHILFEYSDFKQSPTGVTYARKRIRSELGHQQRRQTIYILNFSESQ